MTGGHNVARCIMIRFNDYMTRRITPQDEATTLTIRKAATYLGCSTVHVYRLIRAGVLPAIDISAPDSPQTKTRIRLKDLITYLDNTPSPTQKNPATTTISATSAPNDTMSISMQHSHI